MVSRVLILLIAALVGASAGSVGAHAKFSRAEPAPDATVKTAPKVVRVWFTEELQTKSSTISVLDTSGRRVDDGTGGVDLDDLDRKTLIAKLKPIGPGKYTVKWKATSAEDRDVTEGSFHFTVARATGAR